MSRPVKFTLYLTLGLLFLTGITYALPIYLDRWFFIEIEIPLRGHSLMTLHGLGGFVAIYMLGYLYRGHVVGHLRRGRHKKSGLTLLSILFTLIATGFGLYYFGGEEWRLWAGDIHCLLGVALPLVLLMHRLPIASASGASRQPVEC